MCCAALPVRGSPLSRARHFKVGRIWTYTFIIVQWPDGKVVHFLPYVAGMAMDEQVARSDVEKLQDLLEHSVGKSKKQKGKTEEQHITFENLDQYPYVMWQSAWELDWDKVQALYCPCIGTPHSSSTILSLLSGHLRHPLPALSGGLTRRTQDTLYAHAVLLSLLPLNLLNAVEG